MKTQCDVLIQPVVLRFSLHEDEVVYMFAGSADMQLDRMELLMGVDPAEQTLFDSNVGFLPVATTVLVRGERTIVIDPGNHHTGFYGQLGLSLERFGLGFNDIDSVVCTHSHHDHMASIFRFPRSELVMGQGELDFAETIYGKEQMAAHVSRMSRITEVPSGGELELCERVTAVSTPGHTPGHISVIVQTDEDRVLITGDATMTRTEYELDASSHWYRGEQLAAVRASAARMRAFGPTLVLPGHDRAFRPETAV